MTLAFLVDVPVSQFFLVLRIGRIILLLNGMAFLFGTHSN